MGKKKDKQKRAKAEEKGLDRRAAEFADQVRTPANEGRPEHRAGHRDFSYTQNREVSWLRFDDRVLDEAFDESVPLFERIKFCAIFQSNMDEWFMIRIGGLSDLASLKHQPADNKSDETPAEQLDSVFELLPGMYERRESCLRDLEGRLALEGVERVSPDSYTDADLVAVSRRFESSLAPILSPIIIDPRHPFPNLRNDVMYVACSLEGTDEHGMLGIVEVPTSAQRIVWLPAGEGRVRYTLVEDVVTSMLGRCFGSYVPTSSAVVRVTRNADLDPDGEGVEEEEDYRQHMKKVLKRRSRLQPVRLELTGSLDEALVTLIRKELGLEKRRVMRLTTPADLSYVYALENRLPATRKAQLTFPPFEPQPSRMVRATEPMRPQVEDHDVLLTYPYESMGPLLRLIHEAANDDDCISIKITLYRVARHSRLCESLVTAVENGKDVTVLMELRARFDEQNNIEWAVRLEEAGCITCLGTGNFNEKTARLYSDFMLITAHPGIAEDGNAFFRNLSLGNLRGTYRYLGVAPLSLKPLVMRGIEREMSRAKTGQPARVLLKMNSLTDRDVIDRLAEASQAGVEVIMIIRGICCMLPGVKGRTTGIEIRQIVGRLLEHARIYAFGVDADTIYLSSADMMTRNTERRVEIAYPVLDETCRSIVRHYIALQLDDNVKARRLTRRGTWARIEREPVQPAVNCQEILIAEAYAAAGSNGEASAVSSRRPSPLPAEPPVEDAHRKPEREDAPATPRTSTESEECQEPAATQPERHDAARDPEPPAEVSAHVIEEAQTSPEKPETPVAPLARRPHGRVSTAFALFGLGFKTLFGKTDKH